MNVPFCKRTATENAVRHVACCPWSAVKLEARVVGLLVFHENYDFCDACLAAKLGVAAAEVRAAIAALRRRAFVVLRDRWICQVCGKKGEVTRALAGRTVATQSKLRRRAARTA